MSTTASAATTSTGPRSASTPQIRQTQADLGLQRAEVEQRAEVGQHAGESTTASGGVAPV
jgi:hypothetical protein